MWRVILGFRANKGLVLSSALAFNILLSIVPCFTLLLVALSQLVDDQVLLLHIENNLELVVPGLSETILLQAVPKPYQKYVYRKHAGTNCALIIFLY